MNITGRTQKLFDITRSVAATALLLGCAASSGTAYGQPMRTQAGAFELEVLLDGSPAPTFTHAGESYVMGRLGDRYTLRVHNRSARRVEAVVSVDGLDVIDGKTGDFRHKRGYLVPAWGQVDIDGWRLSNRQAAAFRFSTVSDSYAGRTGPTRNVGVIGVAVFPERQPERVIAPVRPIYPYGPYGSRPYEEGHGLRDKASGGFAAPTEGVDRYAAEKSGRGDDARNLAPLPRRPGLGTEFGEATWSLTHEVEFVRANTSTPVLVLGARYNDRDGLVAMGVEVEPRCIGSDDCDLRQTADPFPVSHRYAAPPRGWRRY